MADFNYLPVDPETACALADRRRREAAGRLLDRLVRPGADNPLVAVLDATAVEARAGGLGEADVEAELAAYNAERRV